MPIFVLRDRHSKHVAAHVVPQKGAHPYAAKRIAQELRFLGYRRLILKGDQEPAMTALLEAIARDPDQDISIEQSP